MFKLLIADDEGKTTVVPLVRDEVTIGRKEGNTIRLTERNVSRKHAKLRRSGTSFFLSDLGSFNGVRVNGRRIEAETELKPGDQVVIGDYQLALQFEGAVDQTEVTATAPMAMPSEGPTAIVAPPMPDPGPPARLVMVSPPAPGAEFALTRPRLRIGRAEDLEIWVNHRSISREHAEITIDRDQFLIRDLGSANGLRINGNETKQGLLRSGDQVELGQVRFRMVGAGEHFHFDAERTMQMDAIVAPPPSNRTPLYIAAGIIAIALVGAVVVASGSGSATTEPRVTQIENPGLAATSPPVAPPTAPGVPAEAQIAQAVSACQIALNSASFDTAVARADEALRLRPGDAQATACRDQAIRAREEDGVFAAGQQALTAGDPTQAHQLFSQLPDNSPYRSRPEVAQAASEHGRALLALARGAADPAEARGLAEQVVALGSAVEPAVLREAQTIVRRAPARLAAAPAAVRPAPERERPAPPDRSATSARSQERPAATQAVTVEAPANPEDEARICLGNGDNACVIRVLGNGRARSARALAMLAQAQRALTGVPSSCNTISQLLERFPGSPEANRYRPVHVAQCQGH